ncbi:hypothetical protein [Sphingobacterium sp. MYb382]|uniref:hypothetical protein n=1 Tax=Sphingobacterium sp. MYb382 TaxID=2745278 RepID=UPI00309F4641
METKGTYIFKLGMWISCFLFSMLSCSPQIPDNNMKWTAKYDFFDLYKVRLGKGKFNPGSAISLNKIVIPSEEVIILGGEKWVWEFNEDLEGPTVVVLYVSNDKGKSYKEINLEDKYLYSLESKRDYTLIQTNFRNDESKKVCKIYLLDNRTFELRQVDEYIEPEDFMNYGYRNFDGKFIIRTYYGKNTLVNLLEKEEVYEIPKEVVGDYFFNIGNRQIVYKKGQQILAYDVKTETVEIISQLKDSYDYFLYEGDQLCLIKTEFEEGRKFRYGIYDFYENQLYIKTNENESFYRYKNFVCDYRKIGVKPEIRYSYDYGKTWKTHRVQGFTILQDIFGFYKDEFLVTEGIFWHFDSPESGGRVMVGEFVK